MNSRRHVRLLLVIGLITGLAPVMAWTVIAMSAGSIEGQEGWSGGTGPISASVDQTIDQSGLNQRTGRGAWRISNKNYSGNFTGWPFSPGLPVSAGQPLSGAGADQFSATLWFRSASASADGSNIEIDLGTVAGDDRNTFLALTNRADADGGLQLRISEPAGATANFRPTVIIPGIARSVWHRLDIVANFYDGPTNDTVAYALDGVPLANPVGGMTFGTFEGYREGLGSPYVLSNRLYFRSGTAPSGFGAFVNTDAQGFYFDDLFYSVADQSAPGIRLAAYATGFDGMSAGSIQGQEDWSGGPGPISASVDQTIDQSGLNQRTGQGTWRISNKNYNGNFTGWPFSPGLPVSAGQPLSGAGADQFSATLWFRSASPSADGSNIEIDLGTVAGDDRNTFLALTNRADADGGLQLRISEPAGATANFRPTVIIPGIARSVWHRLDIVANFYDGPTNDTVAYALDGVPLANPVGGMTFGTFEGYREGLGSPYVLSNRLYFRSGTAPSGFGAFVNTDAQGFYFDDLFYSVAHRSAPGIALAAYATGFEPILAPHLTVSKSHVGNFAQGQTGAQFTVTVTNSGGSATSGSVTLVDNLPAGLTPTAASGAGWTCGVSGATVNCSRSDVVFAGTSYPPVTITVNVAPNAPASVTNTATISGGGDVNTANNTATDVITILPVVMPSQVDLSVTKTDGQTTYTPGTAISYTITVTNAGPATAAGFSIADSVPATITGVSATCVVTGTGNCGTNGSSGNSVSFTAASLAPGAGNMLTLTVNGTVATGASGTLANTATVAAGAGTTDPNPGNNSATDTDTKEATGVVTEVASFYAFDPAFPGGVSVAVADLTGDGVAEIITGAGPSGGPHVRAFSVAGGVVTEVASFYAFDPAFPGGVTVAAADLTGDGVAEIITGAGPSGGPHVRAFSVAGGVVTEVASFYAFDPAFPGGVTVAAADLTGDGVAEIITGAGPSGGPHVRAFSVAGGVVTEVASFYAFDPAFPGGVTVAAADLTGDGVAEIITGAGPSGGPHVRAFSVAGGVVTEVASFYAFDPAFPGGVTVAAADLTGDGVAEIITGAGPSGGPHVRAFSVAGGVVTEVASFYAFDPAFPGGVTVAAVDLTGDDVAEITTGAGPSGGPHVRVLDVSGVTVK